MKIKYQLLLCILLSPVVSWGQKVLHVQSPDMKTELQVMIGKELEIAITRNGTTVLQPSAIGMDVRFIGILGENPKIKRFFVKFGGNLFFISMVFLFFFLNPIKSCRYVCFLVTLKTPHH